LLKRDVRGEKKKMRHSGWGVVLIWEGLVTLLGKGVFKMKIWRGRKSKNRGLLDAQFLHCEDSGSKRTGGGFPDLSQLCSTLSKCYCPIFFDA
jgi:hypothetical protein